MVKYALNLFIKLMLFAGVMLIVAKVVPYDGLVNLITDRFDYESANKLTSFIMGENDPEAWESLGDYFGTLINTLISVPVMGAIIIVYDVLTRSKNLDCLLKEWVLATLRRFAKLFEFSFLFWGLFRILPYQSLFPDNQNYSTFTMMTVVSFNLLLTIICYWFITKKTSTKRSL